MKFNKVMIALMFFVYALTIEAYQQRPLKILFVVEYFPSASQIYILNIMTSLMDRGHDISIFAFSSKNHYGVLPLSPKIKKYGLLERVTYKKFPEPLPESDIVFCQFGNLGRKILAIESLSEWLKQRKLVVCFRGFDLIEYGKNSAEFNKYLFNEMDLLLPVCDYFKKQLTVLGCPGHKIAVHHSGIDCAQFFFQPRIMPKKDDVHFVSVGRFIQKKGIQYALQAFAQIAKKHKNVHFTIVGDGPERENFELMIKELNISKKVTILGWKSQRKIISILSKSHIFLLPSITHINGNIEGIPNALKEAMAMGLISIATWHTGIPELIQNGISGFLVPEKDTSALVKAIKYVMNNPNKWKLIGLSAREKIKQEFESKKLAQKLEKIFYSLLDCR